jgi:hypothetical protein
MPVRSPSFVHMYMQVSLVSLVRFCGVVVLSANAHMNRDLLLSSQNIQ